MQPSAYRSATGADREQGLVTQSKSSITTVSPLTIAPSAPTIANPTSSKAPTAAQPSLAAETTESFRPTHLNTTSSTESQVQRPVAVDAALSPNSPDPVKTAVPYTAVPTPLRSALKPEQVITSVRASLVGGAQMVELALHPEALGRTLAIIHREATGLRLEFEAERPEARRAIESQSASLKESLAAAGFSNVSIEVRAPENRSAEQNLGMGERRHSSGDGRQEESPQKHREAPEPQRRATARRLGYNSFEIVA